MNRSSYSILLPLLLVLAIICCTVSATRRLPLVTDLLHRELMQQPHSADRTASASVDVVIFLKQQQRQVQQSVQHENVDLRASVMVQSAMDTAHQTQRPILAFLTAANCQCKVTSLWISNAIAVHGLRIDHLEHIVRQFAPLIDRIATDKPFRPHSTSVEFEAMLDESMRSSDVRNEAVKEAIEWNLPWVQATDMWRFGFHGEGITVAVADTGIQYDHPALIDHYRGNMGNGHFVHHYNWWDAIKSPMTPQPGPCGINATVPCDDNGHGTHCTGTVVGATADGSRQIGVAPGATFIGCRNMHNGMGRASTYIACLQFFVAPTDLNGRNADPSKRPHIISNSYICTASELCEPDSLREATKFVRNAGIFMSAGAGNDGPSCSSINSPPAIQDDVFTVAALAHKSNTLASFSSRGPITVDRSGRSKPDISAPGQGIMSAYPKNDYRSLSGTSMATPHVAGVVALLWSAEPSLQRNVDLTERLLSESALPIHSLECQSKQSSPNHLYGHGGIRAFEAYSRSLKA